MEDHEIINLYYDRAQQAITETSGKYNAFLGTLSAFDRNVFVCRYWHRISARRTKIPTNFIPVASTSATIRQSKYEFLFDVRQTMI